MFLNKLIVILICLLALELILVVVYVKFKIQTISKKIMVDLKKCMSLRVASLHKTNRKHEAWINTLSAKMDAFEITGKIRKVDEEVLKKIHEVKE